MGASCTAEDQVAALERLICDAHSATPMERLTLYSTIIQSQLTLNVMLLNRIRSIETGKGKP